MLVPGVFVIVAAAFSSPGQAAEASFLRNYVETRGFTLGRPVRVKPTPDGKSVLFLRAEPRNPRLSLYEFDVSTGGTKQLLTPEAVLKGTEERISPEEKARRERMRVSAGGFTSYELSEDGKLILLSLSGKLYVYQRPTGAVRQLATGEGTLLDPKLSPDGKKVAYVLDYDVYVYDLETNKERAVTAGGTEVKTNGLAEFVAQEEMGRFTGYWWSPDSTKIAYEEADHTGVEIWYISDPARPSDPPRKQYYPRPGKKNVAVRVAIAPITGGDPVWIEWDRSRHEYLAAVEWDRQGPLTIQVQDRKQQQLVLLRVDAATGRTTTLLVERDAVFLNLQPGMPRWVSRGERFIWCSEARGKPTLQLHDSDGKMLSKLDSGGNDSFKSLASVDDDKGVLYAVTSESPQKSALRRIPITGGSSRSAQLMAERSGHLSASFSKDHDVFTITDGPGDRMPETRLYRNEPTPGAAVAVLPSVAVEPPWNPVVHIEKLGGKDGFYTSIVRPRDFESNRKYPVIVEVYGGPHGLQVVPSMGKWLLTQWLADQGFVVVSIDNRGTPGRGREWERAIYGKLGAVPLEDQVRGLQLLGKKYPEMDMKRVGIYGWSFGGYMSALAVLARPDVFQAAVAGAPVTDWEDYDTHYTERYMGLLPENRQAYDDASLLPLASKLERPLLLIHGTVDDNVYFRHTLRLADALFRAGREFDLLPLPSFTHMVADPNVQERLRARIAGHFQKHLGKPE